MDFEPTGAIDEGTSTPIVVAGRAFEHVGLSVPDLDRAVEFFVTVFGARVEFRMDRLATGTPMGAERLGLSPDVQFALAMLDLGGSRIELLQWWPARADSRPLDVDVPGVAHVAIDVVDVAVALQALEAVEGVAILGETVSFDAGATPGLTNAFVRTPWGSLIELVTWRATERA